MDKESGTTSQPEAPKETAVTRPRQQRRNSAAPAVAVAVEAPKHQPIEHAPKCAIPPGTILRAVSTQSWRLLSDDSAYDLKPVCDKHARPVARMPAFTKLSVWEFTLEDDPERSQLLHLGWRAAKLARDEVAKLSSAIRFIASFQSGEEWSTVYLSACTKDDLRADDLPNTPSYLAKLQEMRASQDEYIRERRKNDSEPVTRRMVCQALGIGDRQARNFLHRVGWKTPEGGPKWPKNKCELAKLLELKRDQQEKTSNLRSNRWRNAKAKRAAVLRAQEM